MRRVNKHKKMFDHHPYHVGGYFSSAELCGESKKWKQVTQGAPCVKHGFPHENKEVVEQDGVD